ncbi:hypothetical protein AB1Y20_023138 [Prymnesium parvum]|uniref:Uncharacterized protein n=1 Tax=Prymnesium parvum TaxID=97485 RepID=A0AB34JEK2_PRYPA
MATEESAAEPELQESPEEVEVLEEMPVALAGAKRHRRSMLELLQGKVEECKAKMEKKDEAINKLKEKEKMAKKEQEKLSRWIEDRKALELELLAAQEKLKTRQECLDKQEEERVEKAAKKQAVGEAKEHMSAAGVAMLVELKMKYEPMFNNHVDKVESVWEQLHKEFMKEILEGRLPPGDERSVQALKARYSHELAEFRHWCHIADRAVKESGVAADEVEVRVQAHYRDTTKIFIRHGYWKRPMSVPPWRVSGENAAQGGEGPSLWFPDNGEDDDEDCNVQHACDPADKRTAEDLGNEAIANYEEATRARRSASAASSISGPNTSSVSGSSTSAQPLRVGGAGNMRKAKAKHSAGAAKAGNDLQEFSNKLEHMFARSIESSNTLAKELSNQFFEHSRQELERDRAHQLQMAQQCRQQ